MKKFLMSAAIMTAFVAVTHGANRELNYAMKVDPFIGTEKMGNTTPAAQMPFGMISPGPVSAYSEYGQVSLRSGYDGSSDEIIFFTLTRISGVGLHALGDLPFMPVSGGMNQSPIAGKTTAYTSTNEDKEAYKSEISNQKASPGVYSVRLDTAGIDVKMSSAMRSSIIQFDYLSGTDAGVVLCPANCIKGISDSSLKINPKGRALSGWVDSGGFSDDHPFDPKKFPYRLYFYAEFNVPFAEYGLWKGAEKKPGETEIHSDRCAAYLSFGNKNRVSMRIGISYVDEEGAKENLRAEIQSWDIEALCAKADAVWNEKLSVMTVEGCSDEDKTIWYTALYHNLLHPNVYNDVDGRYIGFDDQIHQVESGRTFYANYSLWDTYRTTGPLHGMIIPEEAGDMAETMLLAAEQGGGGLPIWTLNHNDTRCMGTYPGPIMLANLVAFGAENVDMNRAHQRMVAVGRKSLPLKKAGGMKLGNYLKKGWVENSGSETLEYCITDYSIAKFCERMGDKRNADYFYKRSGNWKTLVYPDPRGIWARRKDGSWINPGDLASHDGFTEGNSVQYMWLVPQDTPGLIGALGGKSATKKILDEFFSELYVNGWHIADPHYWLGNEPCFSAPYIYLFLDEPDSAQRIVSRIAGMFKAGTTGIPGNDDVGALSALYLFSAMGLYPYFPGTAEFVLTGSRFPKIQIKLGEGKQLEILAENAGSENPYIQSVEVNGKPWTSFRLPLKELTERDGGTIKFVMGPLPNPTWGSDKEGMWTSSN